MLTRIEIDGFKTFSDYALDLSPFVAVVGPNASGKSNQFDAVQLLARLADGDLREAVKALRGEPHELFRRYADGAVAERIHLAAEVLLSPTVRDPWGSDVSLTHTRLRYEVTIERRRDPRGMERLYVAHEAAYPVLHKDDPWRPLGRQPSAAFQRAFMRYRRRPPFLETVRENGAPGFAIHHDGQSGRTRSAQAAEATVLSSITSTEFPHLYALRQEMRSWRYLQLDAAALRRPSAMSADDVLEPDGANLATVLARLQAETATEGQPTGRVANIAADLAGIIPGVVDLHVEEDDRKREYRVNLGVRDEYPFSSGVVSDGTLRVLALLTMLHDPRHGGLVCLEEPENGVHPAWLRALIRRLRRLVSDLTADEVDPDAVLSQVLVNTHSPVVLSELEDGEMVYADLRPPAGEASPGKGKRTVVRPVVPHDQGALAMGDAPPYITRFDVDRFLTSRDLPER